MKNLERLLHNGWAFLAQSSNSIFLENKYSGNVLEYNKQSGTYKQVEHVPKFSKGKVI